jgi:plastocyanin
VLASCGRPEEDAEGPEEVIQSAAVGTPVDPATAGTLSGVVKLEGAPPRMRTINMAAVPNCARQHPTPAPIEDVLPGENGTLQNVVVYLRGDFSSYSFPEATTPVTPATMDQKGCIYRPRAMAIRVGAPFRVLNSDPVTHNVSAITKSNRGWNETQAPGAPAIERVFARPEVAVTLKCNIHPWMTAHVAIFSHPYFQVTGKDGSFTLAGVPPGTYTVSAWHERYGNSEQTVTLGPKGEERVTITFKAGGG